MQSSESFIPPNFDFSLSNIVQLPVTPEVQCAASADELQGELAPLPRLTKNQEVADYFGVKVRTVQNWSAAIRDTGIQLERDRDGSLLPSAILEYQKVRDMGVSEYLVAHGVGDTIPVKTSPTRPKTATAIALAKPTGKVPLSVVSGKLDLDSLIQEELQVLEVSEAQTWENLTVYEAELVADNEAALNRDDADFEAQLREEARKGIEEGQKLFQVRKAARDATLTNLQAKDRASAKKR